MLIEGEYYPFGSAACVAARLSVADEQYSLQTEQGDQHAGQIRALILGQRLGRVQRKITLPDGSVFSTADNDAVDQLASQVRGRRGWLHKLESNLGFVLVSIVLVGVCTFAFFKWGVPWVSERIAHALPEKTNQVIAEHTLNFLDDYIFEPSQLSDQRQHRIREDFKALVSRLPGKAAELDYQLHFRDWSSGELEIPNALALPSGDLILTDKFVELSENADQINAVLLHEVGHVVHRHSLTMVVESTLVTVIVMLTIGDASGIADIGVGLGSLLVSSNYSRAHESEADLYAFERMLELDINPRAFSEIMQSMTQHFEKKDSDESNTSKQAKPEKTEVVEDSKDIFDYLSSHPNTQERIERARRFGLCFENKVALCSAE